MTKTTKAELNSTMVSQRARPEILAMGGYASARSIEKLTTGTIFLDANECAFEPFVGAHIYRAIQNNNPLPYKTLFAVG